MMIEVILDIEKKINKSKRINNSSKIKINKLKLVKIMESKIIINSCNKNIIKKHNQTKWNFKPNNNILKISSLIINHHHFHQKVSFFRIKCKHNKFHCNNPMINNIIYSTKIRMNKQLTIFIIQCKIEICLLMK